MTKVCCHVFLCPTVYISTAVVCHNSVARPVWCIKCEVARMAERHTVEAGTSWMLRQLTVQQAVKPNAERASAAAEIHNPITTCTRLNSCVAVSTIMRHKYFHHVTKSYHTSERRSQKIHEQKTDLQAATRRARVGIDCRVPWWFLYHTRHADLVPETVRFLAANLHSVTTHNHHLSYARHKMSPTMATLPWLKNKTSPA